jgi:glycosyltransferase involved in cell wall biosynthesis
VKFLFGLRDHVERLVLLGRLDPSPGTSHYRVPDAVQVAGLPHYESLADPAAFARTLPRALRHYWRALDSVDAVWLHGPHPVALLLAVIARLRRRKLALAVRQDLPRYTRSRRPNSRPLLLAAYALEAAYRLLARRYPVVVVGPDLARNYASAPRLLELSVSMVSRRDLDAAPDERSYDGELSVLTVGRLDAEKNPLLLVDILERLSSAGGRWRLKVVGDGPMRAQVERRLADRGVDGRAELLGYVPLDRGLLDLYRTSHVFLHVSWTEGVPQVLFEAFGTRLPVVATAVGGVAEAAGDAAVLIPPGDADAAADALRRVASDEQLRDRLVSAGLARVRPRTVEAECGRVADFLARR